jgi:hypothetical protein
VGIDCARDKPASSTAKVTAANAKSSIDRVYDTLEQGAIAVGALLGVDVRDDAPGHVQDAPPARSLPSRAVRLLPLPEREPFRIIESIDAATAKPLWTVTNGIESCDCPSKVFATEVLAALRAKGAR